MILCDALIAEQMQLSTLVQAAVLSAQIKMSFFKRISNLLRNPKKYFLSVRKEGFNEPFVYYLIFLFMITLSNTAYELKVFNISWSWYPLAYVVGVLISLIGFFMLTGMIHLFLRLIGGKGKYDDTLKGVVYAGTPQYLWGIVVGLGYLLYFDNSNVIMALGIVSVLFGLYSIVLEVIGMKILHKLSTMRAFLGCFLLPALVVVAVLTLVVLFVIMVLLPNIKILI